MAVNNAKEPAPSIFPGATISGRFRLEWLLGRGSMGSVWLHGHVDIERQEVARRPRERY